MAGETATPAPRWFSIREAADYLGIGEQTLYRWMRENRITYRKVGDSTRFLQADLDAVVEVHPSAKDAERVTRFCPSCHHDELVEGQVRGAGLQYFYPRRTRFWTLQTSELQMTAWMCTRCGLVQQFGDTAKLRALVAAARRQAETAAAPAAAGSADPATASP